MGEESEVILHNIESTLDQMVSLIAPNLMIDDAEEIFGPSLAKFVQEESKATLIDLLLRGDVLRVVLTCLYADGALSKPETEAVFDLTSRLAEQLSRARQSKYGAFSRLTESNIESFFKTYWKDAGVLGFACKETKWRGLYLCRLVDAEVPHLSSEAGFLRALINLAECLISIDGDPGSEGAFRQLKSGLSERLETISVEGKESNDHISEDAIADFLGVVPATHDSSSPGPPSESFTYSDDEAEPVDQGATTSRLSRCPDCEGTVSRRAASCPHCGCPLRGKATEARVTVFREYSFDYSGRRTAVLLDSRLICDLYPSDGKTVVIEPGPHSLKFAYYGLLSGERTELQVIPFNVDLGEHLIFNFQPFGGLLGNDFLWEVSKKLD